MFAEKQQQGGEGCDDGDGDVSLPAFRALDLLDGAQASNWNVMVSNVPQSNVFLNHDAISHLQFTPPIEVCLSGNPKG